MDETQNPKQLKIQYAEPQLEVLNIWILDSFRI